MKCWSGCGLIWGSTGEGFASKLTQLLAAALYSWAIELRISIYCCLLARDTHPQFLPNIATYFFQVTERGTSSKRDVTVLYNMITEVTSFYHFCHIYWLEARPKSCPHSRGVGYTGCNWEVGIMATSESVCPRRVKTLKVTQLDVRGVEIWLHSPHF